MGFCNQESVFTINFEEMASKQKRFLIVICLTLLTMLGEIVAGRLTGSMALEADGYHMASHAGALFIAYVAYLLTSSQRFNLRMNFGTGKILSLGGYTSAVLLAMIAFWMFFESIRRLLNPVDVEFNEALFVAALGLVVNLVSAYLLGWGGGGHDHSHHHHDHSHQHHDHSHQHHGHSHQHHDHTHQHHDHTHDRLHNVDRNHESALMHVLADALTSVLAIVALFAGKYTVSAAFLDPLMGILGSVLIVRWSWNLLKQTAWELLDAHPVGLSMEDLRMRIENDGHVVRDLHIWSQGQGSFVGMLAVAPRASEAPHDFKKYFGAFGQSLHLVVERLDSDTGNS